MGWRPLPSKSAATNALIKSVEVLISRGAAKVAFDHLIGVPGAIGPAPPVEIFVVPLVPPRQEDRQISNNKSVSNFILLLSGNSQ